MQNLKRKEFLKSMFKVFMVGKILPNMIFVKVPLQKRLDKTNTKSLFMKNQWIKPSPRSMHMMIMRILLESLTYFVRRGRFSRRIMICMKSGTYGM